MGGRLDPALAAVRHAVRRELCDLEQLGPVLVACSGGADSLALAAATAFVAPRVGRAAACVTVDHGLHADSAVVAAQVAATAEGLGLRPVEVVRVSVRRGGHGLEAAARDARYAALDAAADRLGACAVLLGHTRDDQAEQVLLGLARGSGARSLAGMARSRGRLRRPLLDLPRSTTGQACRAAGLTPWEDPANADPAYLRSRVRGEALPVLEQVLGPGVAAALARTAAQLRADADALDALAADALRRTACPDGAGHDVQALAAQSTAVRTRVLRLLVGRPLTAAQVAAVDALVVHWHGQGPVRLPGGLRALRAGGRLTVESGP